MDYEVVGLLGRGTTAVVELAVDGSGRRVARKRVLLTGSARDIEVARARLRREISVTSALRHPAIVPVLAVEDDGADVVLVLPALAGSLADRVASGGPLPAGQVVAMGRRLLDALAAAHRAGVVHRDITPANILLDDAGLPLLADFGLAVVTEHTVGLTANGTVLGTPAFIAPEQARGESVGPAADVFSLAATLAWAATGQGPWGHGRPDVLLARAARSEVVRPAGLPSALGAPLAAMLDPDPLRRPSAAAVLGGSTGTVVHTRAAGGPGPEDEAGPLGGAHGSSRGRRLVGRASRTARAVVLGRDPHGPGRRPWYRRPAPVALATLATAGATLAGVSLTGAGSAARPVAVAPVPVCVPLTFQPCGLPAAPHTDGSSCLSGWYDLDGAAADGCEAHSDYVAGTALPVGSPVAANLVPAATTDSFTTHISGSALDLCWGSVGFTLTAPAGTADRVAVWHGSTRLAQATSVDGRSVTATVDKPSCFGADTEDLTVSVTGVAGASARDFSLRRSGGW